MDQRDIDDIFNRHRRQVLQPWLCRCGLRHPCPPRRLAFEEQVKIENRVREAEIMKMLRRRAEQERNRRAMSPVEPGANMVRWW